jgi:DNA-binding LacI/PurR family transcriptional regulator
VPGLTTVATPTVLLGQSAVQTLLAMRKGAQPRRDQATVLPVRLVVRESTGPVRS